MVREDLAVLACGSFASSAQADGTVTFYEAGGNIELWGDDGDNAVEVSVVEGLLFSANTFMVKAASGVGVMLAGFVLKLIGLPKGAMPETIDVQTVTNLGIAEATLLFVLGALASVFFSGYRLDREQHTTIVKELRARRLS